MFLSGKETACVCLLRAECWQHWFATPSGLVSVAFFWGHHLSGCQLLVKRPDSLSVVCWPVFAYLLLCRYQSVGASWGDCRRHYLGDEHDHQPGEQQVRWWCILLLRLLSFNLSAHHSVSRPSSCHFVSSSLSQHAHRSSHTENIFSHIFSTHTVQMQAYSLPAWDHCSSCRSYMGGHVCHKCIGSWRQIALLP